MLKFSAGYSKINPNFVIQNIESCKNNCEPAFNVFSNILQRGCPTIPSRLLKENFGKIQLVSNYTYVYDFSNCCWDYVIKGGDSYNPALDFYKNRLAKVLGFKNAKTFIPECPLSDIVKNINTKNVSEYVDFYSPLYNVVIEIDGEQHSLDSEQVIKDENRDKILKSNNVKIIRLTTRDLQNDESIKQKLSHLEKNRYYVKAIFNNELISDSEKKYLTAIRMEMLLLNLYKNYIIKIEDKNVKFNIFSPDNIEANSFEVIIKDFYLWLRNIFNLRNINLEIPRVKINLVKNEEELSKQDGINIYISLFEVYSQTNYDNIYYIKNDYFLYEENLCSIKNQFNGPSSYLYKKNYFSVEYKSIKYNLTEDKHRDSLRFILSNISNTYDNFRENQLQIIIECLNNTSVIGVLPTGAGKSLCYQIAALLIPSKTLLIAPLQLLMVDQYNNLIEKLGITNCTYINSNKTENFNIFIEEKSLITIISPERFFSEKFTKSLSDENKVGFIVIDEAHCLSEWGHDFRTSYLCLSHNLDKFLPSSTYLMALTGTASHRVFEDIDCEFQTFKKKKTNAVFADNMRRDNLTILIQRTDDKYKELIDNIAPTLLGINKDKTLIFTKKKSNNRDNKDSACVTLTKKIKDDFSYKVKIDSDIITYYSGGDELSPEKKEKILQDFKTGKSLIVLATKAFGMGVDIPDIRKTIHYGLPSSFESLYQQFGRAGRDGKPSKCFVYYTPESKQAIDLYFSLPPISIKEMEKHLDELNELSTNFYFIQSANLDVDIEERVVKRILEGIKTRNKLGCTHVDCKKILNGPFKELNDTHLNNLSKNLDSVKTIIERALYRLYLLGEINMWSLVYDNDITNPTFNNLKLTGFSEKEKLNLLKTHIEKYETKFKFDLPNTFENRLRFLLEWANQNYLQERIQTLKTLYEQCEIFTNSEVFMTYISNYFSNDPIYMRLVDKNIRLAEWIEALKTHPEKTKARIARLLESYEKIVPLNFVSGITRLRLDEFDNPDGKRRLNLALEEIKNYSQKDRDYLLKNTLNLLNENQQNIFIECWLNYFTDDVYLIYENTKSKTCEDYIIINFINELLKIGEKLND